MLVQSANVIAGSGALYLAPSGTALPTLVTMPTDSTWTAAGFVGSGYTDDGVQIVYTPQVKDITVDEEMSPVQILLIGEKLEVSVAFAEVTLNNLLRAIAGSSLVEGSGISTLYLGSPLQANVQQYVAGFMGPAPGLEASAGVTGRVMAIYRLVATAAITQHWQRKDKLVFKAKFTALANSTQTSGQKLGFITDYNQAGS
jgi:hypothetical protein